MIEQGDIVSWGHRKQQEERFADAILDVALDMLIRDEMTNEEWKEWERVFVCKFDMKGFKPQNLVKLHILEENDDGQ